MKIKTFACFALAVGTGILYADSATPKKVWPEKLRGFNTGGPKAELATDTAFKRMKGWNVNVVRLNFGQDRAKDRKQYKNKKLPQVPPEMKPYRIHLSRLDKIMQLCKKYDINLILSVSAVVGRDKKNVAQEGNDVYTNTGSFEKNLTDLWTYLVKKYKNNPRLIGYDLLNEPHTKDEMKNWRPRILPDLIKAIRKIDKETTLVVMPGPWGLPSGFNNFTPVNDKNVVYSFHFYAPHNYTHQGVGKNRRDGSGIYPGKLKMFNSSPEIMWNKNTLRENMMPAIKFAKKHKVRMFVGEFSVIRWAKGGGPQWVEDAISLFDENNFDWAYHSYTSWNGWNPTFGPDAKSSNEPDGGQNTPILQVLKKNFAKNK